MASAVPANVRQQPTRSILVALAALIPGARSMSFRELRSKSLVRLGGGGKGGGLWGQWGRVLERQPSALADFTEMMRVLGYPRPLSVSGD
jgi:hypothetical protein